MAHFCCSIETEPRTLNQGQLNHAREVAVDVVRTKEPSEASSIFIEGMQPVPAIRDMAVLVVADANQPPKAEDRKNKNKVVEASCQCSCTSTIMESPDQTSVKEPLSAPF